MPTLHFSISEFSPCAVFISFISSALSLLNRLAFHLKSFASSFFGNSESRKFKLYGTSGMLKGSLQNFPSPSTPRRASSPKKYKGKRQRQYTWSAMNDISMNGCPRRSCARVGVPSHTQWDPPSAAHYGALLSFASSSACSSYSVRQISGRPHLTRKSDKISRSVLPPSRTVNSR